MSDLTSQTKDQMERDHDKIDRLLRERDEARALLRRIAKGEPVNVVLLDVHLHGEGD